MLNLRLTPGGHGAFRIHVLLDNPWKGQEIGVVSVPAAAEPRRAQVVSVSVPAVEGLAGKHALYLVADGADIPPRQDNRPQWGRQQQPQRPEGLFDLHGIGFTKAGQQLDVPVVPQISITADGQQLSIPATPVRTTNQNGYTDLTRYQVYAPLKSGSQLKAESNVPGVRITVSPVTDGRATIRCTYKGKEKVYLVN